jgi:hypothetical protein
MFLTRVFLLLVSLEIELFDSCETPVHFKQALKLLSISYVCRWCRSWPQNWPSYLYLQALRATFGVAGVCTDGLPVLSSGELAVAWCCNVWLGHNPAMLKSELSKLMFLWFLVLVTDVHMCIVSASTNLRFPSLFHYFLLRWIADGLKEHLIVHVDCHNPGILVISTPHKENKGRSIVQLDSRAMRPLLIINLWWWNDLKNNTVKSFVDGCAHMHPHLAHLKISTHARIIQGIAS